MNYEYSDIYFDDIKAYSDFFKENIFYKHYTKHNYTICMDRLKLLTMQDYFHIYENDQREPINYNQYIVFRQLCELPVWLVKQLNRLCDYWLVSRIVSYDTYIQAISELERKQYIKIKRNFKKNEIRTLHKNYRFKMGIDCYNQNGEQVNLTRKQRKQRFYKLLNEQKAKRGLK